MLLMSGLRWAAYDVIPLRDGHPGTIGAMSPTVRQSMAQGGLPGRRPGSPLAHSPGPSFWVAVVLWVTSIGVAIWAFPAEPSIIAWVSFTTVGGLLVWLKPMHPVGWLLIVDGLTWIGGAAVDRYVTLPSSTGLFEAIAAGSLDLVAWIVAIGLIPLTLLVVPTGRLIGRWDRAAAISIVAGGVCFAILNVTTAASLPSFPNIDNPFQVTRVPVWVEWLLRPAELAFLLGVIGALIVLIARFVRSSGVRRQQLRWLAFGGVMILVGFAVGKVLTTFGLPGEPWANTLPMLAVPLAIGVAVLRFRIWDLDLLVRGTIVYGLVAIAVTTVYVVLVAGVGAMAERAGAETWLAILATAIAATLFQPMRHGAATAVNSFLATRGAATPALMVRTLGGFRVERNGVPVPLSEWRSRKARQLLKMLAARRGRPLHREQVIAALWPEADTGNLSNRLAVALSTLRSVLDPEKSHESSHYVGSTDGTLQLRLDHVTVDLEVFMERAVSAETLAEMREADTIYRGEFLVEDLYEDWARSTREEARAAYLTLLRRRVAATQDLHPAEALDAMFRILEIDPWDESAHVGLIREFETTGRHGEARRARERYEEMMAEIGVSPQSE